MMFAFSSATDVGRVRDNNEDSVAFDAASGVAVLADGMGGYNAGEVASAMATSYICTELSHWLRGAGATASDADVALALADCVAQANLSIYRSAMANPQYQGMGTTLVAGVFGPGRVVLAHVGDSRCYRLREGRLTQLTKDHSLLQEQIDAGLLTPEQAKTAPHKNLVTRALGVEDLVRVDVQQHQPHAGDVYLLCSDGLTDMVDDADILATLQQPAPLPELAASLVHRANAAGGRDNVSVLLVQAQAKSAPSGPLTRLLRKA